MEPTWVAHLSGTPYRGGPLSLGLYSVEMRKKYILLIQVHQLHVSSTVDSEEALCSPTGLLTSNIFLPEGKKLHRKVPYYYSKTMFLGLSLVYNSRFKCNTHNNYNYIIKTK